MRRLMILVLLAASACAPVYVPNVRNSPMFTKEGEFQASVQIGNGLEAQAAYAVTGHFGVMANFAYVNTTDSEDEDDYHRHQFFEGGVGYFLDNISNDSFFEVFAGYGRGKGSTFDGFEFFGPQSVAATGTYERIFLQPSVGMNKDDLHFAFAPRISVVDFLEFSNESYSAIINEKPKVFFEPAIIGKANFADNTMFAIFQAGVSLGMSQDIYFDRRTFQLSAGLGLRLGGARKLVRRL